MAVFGSPIAHSKSPDIHQMFADQFNMTISYARILGKPSTFIEQLSAFFDDPDAIGANITMPFKEDAANWATERSTGVAQANAANTIIRQAQGFRAETTDGRGLVSDLLRNDISLQGKQVLLIGAGGAARGAIEALLAAKPAHIYITNRSEVNAKRLVSIADDNRVSAVSGNDCEQLSIDVIINATSLSLSDKVPAISDAIFNNKPAVYDMVYRNTDTCFIKKAKSFGCTKVSDGLGMLVGQAAESFYLWFGMRPDVEPVLQYLRQQLVNA
ncbi:shikimate dehydrogenase [Glaciecola sp. 33A]|nr:shikimate dehydrogenase [Glaciecola sp. 33A]